MVGKTRFTAGCLVAMSLAAVLLAGFLTVSESTSLAWASSARTVSVRCEGLSVSLPYGMEWDRSDEAYSSGAGLVSHTCVIQELSTYEAAAKNCAGLFSNDETLWEACVKADCGPGYEFIGMEHYDGAVANAVVGYAQQQTYYSDYAAICIFTSKDERTWCIEFYARDSNGQYLYESFCAHVRTIVESIGVLGVEGSGVSFLQSLSTPSGVLAGNGVVQVAGIEFTIPNELEYEGADSGVDCWANADRSLRMSLCVEEYVQEGYNEADEPSLEQFAKGYMTTAVPTAAFPSIQGDVQETEPELVGMEGEVPVLVGSVAGGGLMSPRATYVFMQTPEDLVLVVRLSTSRGSLSATQGIDVLVNAIVSSVHPIPVEEEPEPAADVQEIEDAEVDGDYQQYDYEEYARYPEAHFFESVVLSGTVAQVVGSRGDDDYAVRLATRGGSSDVVYVYISFDLGYNILEDDRLTVYGYALGTITYQAVLGNSITIPAVTATSVVLG